MKLRPSRILAQLRRNQLPTSFKVNLNDPRVIEIAGLSGCDAVWICQEHVPNDWSNLEHQIRAARIHNMDSLVRVATADAVGATQPLTAIGLDAVAGPAWAGRSKPVLFVLVVGETARAASSAACSVQPRPALYRSSSAPSASCASSTVPISGSSAWPRQNRFQ